MRVCRCVFKQHFYFRNFNAMFADIVICAGLAVLVAAQSKSPVPQVPQVPQVPLVPKIPPAPLATTTPPGPPRDSNPDCDAWMKKVPGHLYSTCSFICEGDEDFVLRDGQSCFIQDPLEEMPVRRGVRTITGDMGTCKKGKCVLLQSGEPPKMPETPKPRPPSDISPDCNRPNATDYVFENCSFACEGDELFVMRNHEPCILPGQSSSSAISSVKGSVAAFVTGVCIEGKCYLKDTLAPPQKPGQPGPPRDTNPDCAATKTKRANYLYHNCTFPCEGDEEVSLNNKESCILQAASQPGTKNQVQGVQGSADMGFCKDGRCVSQNDKTPSLPTGKPKPPRDTNPDCNAWKTNQRNYLYHNCTFVCEGDEEVPLRNRQSCVLPAVPQSPTQSNVNGALGTVDMGVCLDGRCVPQNNKIPPQMPKLPLPKPPSDINPDCNRPDSTDYVFQNCSFVCERDEATYLNKSEKCVLQGQSPTAISTSSEGNVAAFVTGVCKEGKCVLPSAVLPQNTARPEVPRVRNQDCRSWRKKRSKYTYRNCTFACEGDEEVYLRNNERCFLTDSQTPSMSTQSVNSVNSEGRKPPRGVCNNGKCVPKQRMTTPSIVTSTVPAPPRERNPDCKATVAKVQGYVYHNCTFVCELDEEICLRNNELCILQEGQVKSPATSLTQHTSGAQGVCQDGVCVPQSTKKS
ncbi:uncharacterized protein LOC119446091 [Dermacentor silvarum]|uniref:uncharacterized protein LOC119446091 n=1 Tax=Dermacentor silvarum TaxID=543639 RepID=UPI0018998BB0|nr:uncharacterized protein LOC119446091 [Dermacentor silvarum]